jgi:hypothetical protein
VIGVDDGGIVILSQRASASAGEGAHRLAGRRVRSFAVARMTMRKLFGIAMDAQMYTQMLVVEDER